MHVKYSEYCLTLTWTGKKIKSFHHLRQSEQTTIASSYFNFCSILQIYLDTIQSCKIMKIPALNPESEINV